VRILFGLTITTCLLTQSAVVLAQPTDAQPAPPQPPPTTNPTPGPPGPPSPPPPDSRPTDTPPPIGVDTTPRHGDGNGRAWGHHQRQRPFIGGLGYLAGGFMAGEFSALQKSLQGPLGPGYDTAPMAVVLGGGLGALLGPVWVGGKIFGFFDATTPHSLANTSLTGFAGGAELGYALVANEDWLIVPFIGAGGFNYNLTVQNKGALFDVFPNESVPVGGEREYSSSLWTGEVGLRANRLILFGNAGITVGGELGYMSSLTRDAWTTTTSVSPESSEIRGAYFRIIVGGGAFMMKEHTPRHD
jgi:hypothetical protein